MPVLIRPWGALHYQEQGPADGPALVFANSLGTDLRLWDAVLPLLPAGMRVIRFDKPGHGLSDSRDSESIADLADDVAALITHLCASPAILVGLSIGGMIAQDLAVRRPDLLRGVVLTCTAAKMGDAAGWNARIAAVKADGVAAIADAVMERWFAPAFRATPELALYRNMMARTEQRGYVAACGALAAADLTAATATIALPCLVIAGESDGASPASFVEATAKTIKGAQFHVLSGAGHIPCVETPAAYAALLTDFIRSLP